MESKQLKIDLVFQRESASSFLHDCKFEFYPDFTELRTYVVVVSEIALSEFEKGSLSSALSLFKWILLKLQDYEAPNNDVSAVIQEEKERISDIVSLLEKRDTNLKNVSAQYIISDDDTESEEFLSTYDEFPENNEIDNDENAILPQYGSDEFLDMFRSMVVSPGCKQSTFPRWSDIKGYEKIKDYLYSTIIEPRKYASTSLELYQNAFFLFGPAGTGKTCFAKSIAVELNFSFLQILGSSFADHYVGNNLLKMDAIFRVAKESAPCILFFDEMEGIFPERSSTISENSKENVNEFLSQTTRLLDEFNKYDSKKQVIVCGTSNHPAKLEMAIWRRMEKFIHIPLPTPNERRQIIEGCLGEACCSLLNENDWKIIMIYTEMFSGADLTVTCKTAKNLTVRKTGAAKYFRRCGSDNQKWVPCNPSDEGATPRCQQTMSYENIVHGDFTRMDILNAVKSYKKKNDTTNDNSAFKACLKFDVEYGENIDAVLLDDSEYDEEQLLKDAIQDAGSRNICLKEKVQLVDYKLVKDISGSPSKAKQVSKNWKPTPIQVVQSKSEKTDSNPQISTSRWNSAISSVTRVWRWKSKPRADINIHAPIEDRRWMDRTIMDRVF